MAAAHHPSRPALGGLAGRGARSRRDRGARQLRSGARAGRARAPLRRCDSAATGAPFPGAAAFQRRGDRPDLERRAACGRLTRAASGALRGGDYIRKTHFRAPPAGTPHPNPSHCAAAAVSKAMLVHGPHATDGRFMKLSAPRGGRTFAPCFLIAALLALTPLAYAQQPPAPASAPAPAPTTAPAPASAPAAAKKAPASA